MLGRNSGARVSAMPILVMSRTKPSADTCVGIIMMSRMNVKASFLNLKS